jgi:predicted HicB family RNase H-like nuclease
MTQETLSYKGYTASVQWSEDENCLIGDVVGIEDIIFFRGSTIPEINETFKEMIDWYLESCEKKNKTPDKPPIMIPISSELYDQAYNKAENTGVPVYQFMQKAIQQSVS